MKHKRALIPPYMADLPTLGGLAVPVIFLKDTAGVPDFKVLDAMRVAQCVARNECGMCGKPNEYWLYFIGGPESFEHRLFRDPGMHEQCARYALKACPYLSTPGATYAERINEERHGSTSIEVLGAASTSAKIGLFKTRKYRLVKDRHQWLIRAAPFVSEEWHEH